MTGMLSRYTALAVVVAVATGIPTLARAECEEDETNSSEGRKFHIEERNGEKVYVIDKVVKVCGKVPRPLVAYVLQARTINYQWETLKQDFMPKILDSVKKAPF